MNAADIRAVTIKELERRLCDFDAGQRRQALAELARRAGAGDVHFRPSRGNVNLHMHTFFSYNAEGFSPSRIAWEAVKGDPETGALDVAGIVDFDVLDGIDEFLAAGDALALRATVGLESRVFVREYADVEINSPGEPGVAYFMGMGFFRPPAEGGPGARVLAAMRALARGRNAQMAARVNAHLGPASVDYARDVLALTPSGNATERHMLAAYEAAGARAFPDPAERARYWAERLGEPVGRVLEIAETPVRFRELLRSRLMKLGGIGYAAPERGSFPALDDAIAMTAECEALPTFTWLDGTSAGEADPEELVRFHASKGVAALNVIPDRNWRLADEAARRLKVANLHAIVAAAREAGLLVVHGTERNKDGQPFADDLGNEHLAPVAEALRDGAYALYGHTAMARFAARPLTGAWAREAFSEAASRNRFYAEVGRLLPPGPGAGARLAAATRSEDPAAVLAALRG